MSPPFCLRRLFESKCPYLIVFFQSFVLPPLPELQLLVVHTQIGLTSLFVVSLSTLKQCSVTMLSRLLNTENARQPSPHTSAKTLLPTVVVANKDYPWVFPSSCVNVCVFLYKCVSGCECVCVEGGREGFEMK